MWKKNIIISGIALGVTWPSFAIASVIDRPFLQAQSVVIVIAASNDETNGGTAPVVVDFNLLTPDTSGQAAPDLIDLDGFVNSNSGFDPGHDFSGGASRLIITDEVSGGNFNSRARGGDVDYLEDTDRLTAFGLADETDLNIRNARNVSRFLVASNVAFDVFAESTNLSTSGDFADYSLENIGFRARINRRGGSGAGRWGDAAQTPQVGGTGIDRNINDLGDMNGGPVKFFDGGRRTARSRGSILEQSVSFNIRYAFSDSADSGSNRRTASRYDFSLGTGTIGADVTYTIYTP